MRRNTLNFVVDAVTLLVVLAVVVTGLVIRFVLPPGTGGRHGGRGLVLWGMGRHDWGDVHFWAAVVLGGLLLVHVALHWSWVCIVAYRLSGGAVVDGRPSEARRNAYGIAFLVALVVVFGGFTWYARNAVWEAGSSPESGMHLGDEGPGRGRGGGDRIALEPIRGSMSLADVEAATGVPVDTLRAGLGLPGDIAPDERLGRLGREHGFSMDKVRDIVVRHAPQSDSR